MTVLEMIMDAFENDSRERLRVTVTSSVAKAESHRETSEASHGEVKLMSRQNCEVKGLTVKDQNLESWAENF